MAGMMTFTVAVCCRPHSLATVTVTGMTCSLVVWSNNESAAGNCDTKDIVPPQMSLLCSSVSSFRFGILYWQLPIAMIASWSSITVMVGRTVFIPLTLIVS